MLEIGNVFLERYKINSILGQGGMGCVYLAADLRDHTQWAIKEAVISTSNEPLLYQEAEILSKLTHSSLPKVRQYLKENDCFYIVMEYVEGKTLERLLLDHGMVAEPMALKWFRQICDVLVYLHGLEMPIVYRDLKPSNIMIQPSGDIKLIDFGIAQEYGKTQIKGKRVMALTRGYAAPEQYDKRYLSDARTDIYALGVTMHYLLTGKNPNSPPYHFRPIRKLNSTLSYAMEHIVKKCLQPNPDRRYGNAVLLQEQLKEIQVLEESLQRKRRTKIAGGLIGVTVIIFVSMMTFLSVKKERSDTMERYYTYLEMAEEYADSGVYEEALDTYEEAIQMQPDAWDAYLGVAKVYLIQNEYEKCYDYLHNIADKFPDIFENPEFTKLMNDFYAMQENAN